MSRRCGTEEQRVSLVHGHAMGRHPDLRSGVILETKGKHTAHDQTHSKDIVAWHGISTVDSYPHMAMIKEGL